MTGSVYRRSPSVLFRAFDDEVILGSPDREGFDALPGTARTVWEVLALPRSFEELVTELAQAYEAPADRVAGDVRPLMEQLEQRGWVERKEA